MWTYFFQRKKEETSQDELFRLGTTFGLLEESDDILLWRRVCGGMFCVCSCLIFIFLSQTYKASEYWGYVPACLPFPFSDRCEKFPSIIITFSIVPRKSVIKSDVNFIIALETIGLRWKWCWDWNLKKKGEQRTRPDQELSPRHFNFFVANLIVSNCQMIVTKLLTIQLRTLQKIFSLGMKIQKIIHRRYQIH